MKTTINHSEPGIIIYNHNFIAGKTHYFNRAIFKFANCKSVYHPDPIHFSPNVTWIHKEGIAVDPKNPVISWTLLLGAYFRTKRDLLVGG